MNFLKLFYNMEPIDSSTFELFPKELNGYFYGTTYSIAPSFVNDYLTHIENISIIIGLSNLEYQAEKANQIIAYLDDYTLTHNDIDFVNKLNEHNKNGILNKKLEIRLPYINMHSKMYLLQNKEKTKCRVIIGSANLTEPGLKHNIQQHELVMVFDNDFIFFDELYKTFLHLKEQTIDYISDDTKNILSKNTNKPIILSSSEKIDFRTNKLNNLLISLNHDIEKGKIPDNAIIQYAEQLTRDEQEIKQKLQAIKVTRHLIHQPKNKAISFNTNKTTIKKVIENILPLYEIEKSQDLKRQTLIRDDTQQMIYILENETPILFQKKASIDDVKKTLLLIEEIIQGYKTYSSNYNKFIGNKIFETILYAFTAPYLSYIRYHSDQTLKTEIPVFLFLGGNAGSGKSTMLSIIGRMTQYDTTIKSFFDYSQTSQHDSESERTKRSRTFIKNIFKENNVSPVFIDEIPANFFTTAGEDIIVNTTNTLTTDNHPVMIGTTNSENYSMHERATRRTYYIQMNIPFKENTRAESAEYSQGIFEKLNTTLFQDFLARFADLIADKNTKLFQVDKNGKLDFLYLSRRIFRHYYNSIGMEIPEYFNENLLDDFKAQAKEKWRTLFLSSSDKDNIFTYNKEKNILYFHHMNLNNNGTRYVKEGPSQVYLDALPAYLSERNNKEQVIPIKAKEFFEWLGEKNPYKHTFWNLF